MAKGQIKQKQVNIKKDEFEKLCAMQCTRAEICAFFDVSKDTLWRWCKNTYGENYETISDKKRNFGCIKLRKIQWRLAENNVPMAIWLGKQYLGQRDTRPADESNDEYSKLVESHNQEIATIKDNINNPQANRKIEDYE